MAHSSTCLGHKEREDRTNKITRLTNRPKETPDENLRVWIKKGPVSVETSLKELEENYERKPEWKVIEDGGVLSIPVEELRMENPPGPDRRRSYPVGVNFGDLWRPFPGQRSEMNIAAIKRNIIIISDNFRFLHVHFFFRYVAIRKC